MKTRPMPRTPEPLLTVAEVAARDRCSQKTVRRAIALGLLEAIRIGPAGRAIRIPEAAHERYRRRLWR